MNTKRRQFLANSLSAGCLPLLAPELLKVTASPASGTIGQVDQEEIDRNALDFWQKHVRNHELGRGAKSAGSYVAIALNISGP